jgi:hypothetical protein
MPTMNERGKLIPARFLLWTIGIFAVLLVGLYFWKEIEVGTRTREIEQQRDRLAAEMEQLEEELGQASARRVEELLRALAIPVGWAVRNEAVDKNFDKIEEYAVRLVKEPPVQRVVFAMPDGAIRVTTDRKLQGEPVERFYGDLAQQDRITLRSDDPGRYHLLVPIIGYNNRVGSLILTVAVE